MKNNDDGGPAFPGNYIDRDSMGEDSVRASYSGMTLRDYFAANALTGQLAFTAGDCAAQSSPESAAKFAYECADAMLAARAKTPGSVE